MKNERELKEMQIAYEVFSRCSTIKEALEKLSVLSSQRQ